MGLSIRLACSGLQIRVWEAMLIENTVPVDCAQNKNFSNLAMKWLNGPLSSHHMHPS